MTVDTAFVFGLIAVAGLLMASNRLRYDLVALFVVLALMLSGALTVDQARAGFGSPVVILVAALVIVGAMLERTGAARAVGDWILKRGGSNEALLLVLIMAGAGLLGAVMSSTAVVAKWYRGDRAQSVLEITSDSPLLGRRLTETALAW